MTLKNLWEQAGLTPTEVAGRAGISLPTLYKMVRKERVHRNNIRAVCQVLSISEDMYQHLQAEK